MPRRDDDWIDEDEYPNERDMRDFGDDGRADYDPLTIGYIKGVNTGIKSWSRRRIIIAVCALILLIILLVPIIAQLTNR
jgi:hypothetical protein